MSTINYRDTTLPYLELNPSAYDFIYPINADILDSVNFTPPTDGVYLLGGYGHRYLSNTPNKSDNHGGLDYWRHHVYGNQTFNSTNLTPIVCMCDGYISQVINGPDSVMEQLGTGRSVRVTCDSSFQTLGNKIKINYRHLSSLGPLAIIADTAAFGTVSISKGDTIGRMGASGTTTNIHLHLSTNTLHPVFGNAFVNTNRLFDPTKSPHILTTLSNATVEYLKDWSDSALFRVTWPYNQTINNFEFINLTDTIVFNKEDAYETGSAVRDRHDCLPDINAYAYQFNGNLTVKARYLNEMNNIPAQYPASPQRDTNLVQYGYTHIPITHDSVAFVYDFVVKNISPSHKTEDFIIKLSDIWGYTVEAQLQAPLSVSSLSFEAKNEKNYVDLQWSTASEKNNNYFEIQRSTRNMDWLSIGQVKGKGNTNELNHYYNKDHLPLSGISYYRLKQVDLDGNSSFSKTIQVHRESDFTVSISPNPSKNEVIITSNQKTLGRIILLSLGGIELNQNIKIQQLSANSARLNLSNLSKGAYILQVVKGNQKHTQKLIKE